MSEGKEETTNPDAQIPAALSKAIHYGVPIASVIVLIAFAVTLSLPADKSVFPETTTALFVPIYLTIVVVLVFGSMYLFKRLMDTPATYELKPTT